MKLKECSHYTDRVKELLEAKGYKYVQPSAIGGIYFITPSNQLVRLTDADFICFDLFGKD